MPEEERNQPGVAQVEAEGLRSGEAGGPPRTNRCGAPTGAKPFCAGDSVREGVGY